MAQFRGIGACSLVWQAKFSPWHPHYIRRGWVLLQTCIINEQRKNLNQKQQSPHCQQWSSAFLSNQSQLWSWWQKNSQRRQREEIPLRTDPACRYVSSLVPFPSPVPYEQSAVKSQLKPHLCSSLSAVKITLDVRVTIKPRSLPAASSPVSCSLNASLGEPVPDSLLYSLFAWSQ